MGREPVTKLEKKMIEGLARSHARSPKRGTRKSSLVQRLLELSNDDGSHRSSQSDDLRGPLDGSLVRSVLADSKSESETLVSKSSLAFVDAPVKRKGTKEESQDALEWQNEEGREKHT